MSQIKKTWIIATRVRNKIKPEVTEELCGFTEEKFATNSICILWTVIKQALEVQKEVCLCSFNYTKAFNRIWHDEIITQLTQLKTDGKYLRVIKTCTGHRQQWCSWWGNHLFTKIKFGVKQGCVLSTDLFYISAVSWNEIQNVGYLGIKNRI